MNPSVYWTQAFPITVKPQLTELPSQFDVAIIGGGLTGLSTAFHLAGKGASVVVLEKESIGWGASTRNAGMALTGLKLSPEQLYRRYGRSLARRFYLASLDALSFVEKLIADEQIECDFRRWGELCAAFRPAHFESMKASQRFLQEEFGHRVELIPPDQLKRELGSQFYHGGLLDTVSAGLNPAKLVLGLALAAQRKGAMLFERTCVLSLSRNERGFAVSTTAGVVRAKEVVAATNGYTPPMLRWFRRRVIPIGSYIIVTEPLDQVLIHELIPNGRMVYDSKNFLFYFRRTPDDRVLFGGRTSFIPTDDKSSSRVLQRDMCRVFPQLKSVRVEYAWHGNVAFTFDQMPHLGKMNGVHYAMGYCGHGVVMSIYFGKWLASMLSGEKCDLPFGELSFPARFFYRRQPWFLPLAGGYFRVLDWLR